MSTSGAIRSKRPDLGVLAVMMPDLSGFDVAAVLRTDPSTDTLPIIILSIVQDSARGFMLGVNRYLNKPTDAEVPAGEIRSVLSSDET